ncbi:hypothetical protein [Leptothermofonsia sp. ETS-13]|uniref:hypothetical protein n=1 Tax=Leptothermofonsia sp. ETS-13 TaxID=3035696 RepID=UPI003BA374FD
MGASPPARGSTPAPRPNHNDYRYNLWQDGKVRSTWTLDLLAEVVLQQDITWSRAKRWIGSPDEQYELKKRQHNR